MKTEKKCKSIFWVKIHTTVKSVILLYVLLGNGYEKTHNPLIILIHGELTTQYKGGMEGGGGHSTQSLVSKSGKTFFTAINIHHHQ